MIVDVHSHLNYTLFDGDREEVLKRAKDKGIVKILASGSLKNANKKVLELSRNYDLVEASLGLYPLDAIKLSEDDFKDNLNFIKKNKKEVIAIGEIGLDFVSREKDKEQIQRFREILDFCEKIQKPVILHTRKAEKETIEIMESSKIKGIVFHMFTGNFKLVKRIVDNGWMLSIPPIITYSKHFQLMVERVPMNQLLTETDSPYLSPFKEKRNEPSYIVHTIKKISEIKDIEDSEVVKNIFMNFQNIFIKNYK